MCHEQHSHLVFIETEEEQKALAAILNGFYVNRTHNSHISYYTVYTGGVRKSDGQWYWTDSMLGLNDRVNYTNWVKGHSGFDSCLVISGSFDSEWKDKVCTSKRFYACERPVTLQISMPSQLPTNTTPSSSVSPVVTNIPPSSTNCQHGWVRLHSSCYYINLQDKVTRSQAMNICHRKNSNLVFIESREKQRELANLLNGYHIYKTHHSSDLGSAVWTGGMHVDGRWVWKSPIVGQDIQITYTHWHRGEPDKNGTCMALAGNHDSEWKDYKCDVRIYFMCEKQISSGPGPILIG